VARHLPLDELAERNADGRRAEAGSICRPGFVADLNTRHAISRRASDGCNTLLTLSPSHVYNVDDASAGATVCCEAERSDASGGIT
jgi:hypothetical protein